MSFGLAFWRGVGQALHLWRLVALMSLLNLALALLAGLAHHQTLGRELSVWGEVDADLPDQLDELRWRAGRDDTASALAVAQFGPAIVLEAIETGLSGNLLELDPMLLGLGVAYMLVNAFFAAGVLGVTAGAEPQKGVPEFFAAGARNFPRFFRLLAGSALAYALLLGLLGTERVGLDRILARASSDKLAVFLPLAYAASLALILALSRLLVDYARVALVLDPGAGVLASLGAAARFLLRSTRGAVGLYAALVLASLAGLLGFAALDGALQPRGAGALLLGFLLQQVFIFYKIGLRAAFLCAQLEFFRARRPA